MQRHRSRHILLARADLRENKQQTKEDWWNGIYLKKYKQIAFIRDICNIIVDSLSRLNTDMEWI